MFFFSCTQMSDGFRCSILQRIEGVLENRAENWSYQHQYVDHAPTFAGKCGPPVNPEGSKQKRRMYL